MLPGCSTKNPEKADPPEPPDFSIITDYSELEQIACNAQTDSSMLLIDLRDNSEYEYAHLEGSVNVPFDDDGAWLVKYLNNNEASDKEIYLMCAAGKKSAKAFNLLLEQGYGKLHYVSFGFNEYRENKGGAYLEGAGVCDCEKNTEKGDE